MNTYLKSLGLASIGLALSLTVTTARAVNVTIDSGATWLSYLNVFETPANGGGYAAGFEYNFALNTASFSGSNLTLGATQIDNAVDGFWWVGEVGGPGAVANKVVEASSYIQETGTLAGVSLTFSGTVLSNTLVSGQSVIAFIRDFAPDFSSNVAQLIPLTTGDFSITLDTIDDPARHVQYGFVMTGPNVWVTDVASKGSIVIAPASAIPEPSSFAALAGLATLGLAASRRRRG